MIKAQECGAIKVENGAELIITDSNPEAEHKFTVSDRLWVLDPNGAKTVRGGVITGGKNTANTGNYSGGAGIFNEGIVSMTGGAIVGNDAVLRGGGVLNYGTMTLTNVSILGNVCRNAASGDQRSHGGGIINGHNDKNYPSSSATLSLINCKINENAAMCSTNDNGWGGAMFLGWESFVTIDGCEINNNFAKKCTGAIQVEYGGEITLKDTVVTGNVAQVSGRVGGIFIERNAGNPVVSFSGKMVVSGNTSAGTPVNLKIVRNGDVNINAPLTSGSSIGVTHNNTTGTITTGYSTHNALDAAAVYFLSDNTSYIVAKDSSGEIGIPSNAPVTPVIGTQPVGGNGISHTLTVAATTTDGGTLSYQWYKADTAVDSGTAISEATSSSYEATVTGYYYCVVSNTKNGTSVSAISDRVQVLVPTVYYDAVTNGGSTGTAAIVTALNAPVNFTPSATKNGWNFVGWNTDSTATTGMDSLTMSEYSVTLYAIFSKQLTGTFYSGANATETVSTTIYNTATSGSITAPALGAKDGWTSVGWNESISGYTSEIIAGNTITLTENKEFYGIYKREITLSYNASGGDSTPADQSGTQYLNVHSTDSFNNPSFTIADSIVKAENSFDKWHVGSANGSTSYEAGQTGIEIAENTTLYAGWIPWNQVVAPCFTPNTTEFIGSGTVEISTTTGGATIYYTLDGSEPSASSNLYASAITVDANTTIKAIAVKAGMVNSEITSQSFIIVEPTYTLVVTAPSFSSVTVGYSQPEAKQITIKSTGNSDATIASVALSGTDAGSFAINNDSANTGVTAGGENKTFTVNPRTGLEAGSYSAIITVTYNNGAKTSAEISFSVTEMTPAEKPDPISENDIEITETAVTIRNSSDSKEYQIVDKDALPINGEWKAGNGNDLTFGNLVPGTSYDIYVRTKESSQNLASESVGPLTVRIKESAKPVYTITGEVKDDEAVPGPVVGAGVELLQEGKRVNSAITDAVGTFSINAPAGIYNLVVKYTKPGGVEIITTEMITISGDKAIGVITMANAGRNSELDNQFAGEFAATVGGLDRIAKDIPDSDIAGNQKVTIKLLVTDGESVSQAGLSSDEKNKFSAGETAIRSLPDVVGKTLKFLDLTLQKIITNNAGIDETPINIGENNDVVLDIVIPFETEGKTGITVYRYHSNVTISMVLNPAQGEEGYEVGDGYVIIHTKGFSTYAIGYATGGGGAAPAPGGGGYYWAPPTEDTTDDEPVYVPKNIPIYRLFNTKTGEHFFTRWEEERDYWLAHSAETGWTLEGIAWNASEKNDTPVYRVFDAFRTGQHRFTTSKAERDEYIAKGWTDEGIAWYSAEKEAKKVYRMTHPTAKYHIYHYTASEAEKEALEAQGWTAEDAGFTAR